MHEKNTSAMRFRKHVRPGLRLLAAALITGGIALVLTQTVLAQGAAFGTALLADYDVPEDAFWTIRDPDFPYPRELAQDAVSGCLVAEMTVTKKGTSKDVEIIRSFPDKGIERPFKRTMNRIRWKPLDDSREKREEVRRVRIDFCVSHASQADARNQCAFSILQPCE